MAQNYFVGAPRDNVGDPHAANELFGLKLFSFREGIATYLRVQP
jgi:hypothetical protein